MPDTLWHFGTADHQAPVSRRFSRQGYWSRLPFPSPGIFPTQGSNPGLPHCRQTLYHLSHQEVREVTWPASWEICMRVKKQQLQLDMGQKTGSKSGKDYVKAVYCHSAYLTYMQSTSWEMLGWMKHKLQSRLPREISITSDMPMTPPLWQKEERNWRASWWKWKRRVKKLA